MKTVLVTGVAGFIASKTAEFLLDKGFNVIGVDNLNDYYSPLIKEHRLKNLIHRDNFKFIKCDIENREELAPLFEKYHFSTIYNLAARAGVRYSLENPYVYLSTNTLGTLNLLEFMRERGLKKLVLASTSSLYAGEDMPFSEKLSVNKPISPYAATKKGAELMCYTYHYLFDMDISVVRYFTVYGPCGRPDMSIYRFVKWIDEGTPIELFGDGEQSRDFTFVDDIAKGTIKAGETNVGYEIFNLGGGQNPYSLNTVIKLIEKHLGKPAKIEKKPFHKADLLTTYADIDKAKEILDWSPEIGLEEGLTKTIDDYLTNKEFYQTIPLP